MKKKNYFLFVISCIVFILLFLLNMREGFHESNMVQSIMVPSNLFLTWESKDLPSLMKDNVDRIIEKNPDIHVHIFDNHECSEFIRTHFDPDVLDAYNKLIPGAYKADLWRYCVLYIHGGIYMDIKLEPEDDFRFASILDKEHFVVCRPDRQVWNAFMVCLSGNEKCWKCIRQIVENVRTEFYGDSCLSPTGPFLLASFFTDEEIAGFDMEVHSPLYEKVETDFITILTEDGKEKSIIRKNKTIHSEQKDNTTIKHYYELWSERAIYNK